MRMREKRCRTCKWHSDEFTSVCVNDASDHLADFVDPNRLGCPVWEGKEGWEIYRADMNGAETFLAWVEESKEIGAVMDKDRTETEENVGWYRAVHVGR